MFSGSRNSMALLLLLPDVTGCRNFKSVSWNTPNIQVFLIYPPPSWISDIWLHRAVSVRCNQKSEIEDGDSNLEAAILKNRFPVTSSCIRNGDIEILDPENGGSRWNGVDILSISRWPRGLTSSNRPASASPIPAARCQCYKPHLHSALGCVYQTKYD